MSGEYGNGMGTASATPLEVMAPNGFSYAALNAGDTFAIATFTPVPEPACILAIAFTGIGLACYCRRRIKNAVTLTVQRSH